MVSMIGNVKNSNFVKFQTKSVIFQKSGNKTKPKSGFVEKKSLCLEKHNFVSKL